MQWSGKVLSLGKQDVKYNGTLYALYNSSLFVKLLQNSKLKSPYSVELLEDLYTHLEQLGSVNLHLSLTLNFVEPKHASSLSDKT